MNFELGTPHLQNLLNFFLFINRIIAILSFFFKLKLERHTFCNNNNNVIDKSMKLEYINNFLRKKIKTIDSYKLYFSVNDETTFMNMQFFQTKIIPVLRE